MVDIKRGVSPKDLRPFSVDDPLGDKRRSQRSPVWTKPSTGERPAAPLASVTVTPELARKWARLGCLLPMILVWAIGILAAVAPAIPELVEAARPAIESLLARLEVELKGAEAPPPSSDPLLAQPDPPPRTAPDQPSDAPAAPAPPPDVAPPPTVAPTTELGRVCERTVQCCLTVQGERARSICENFRRMPVVEPCEQAYEAFAQVGRQMGRVCQE